MNDFIESSVKGEIFSTTLVFSNTQPMSTMFSSFMIFGIGFLLLAFFMLIMTNPYRNLISNMIVFGALGIVLIATGVFGLNIEKTEDPAIKNRIELASTQIKNCVSPKICDNNIDVSFSPVGNENGIRKVASKFTIEGYKLKDLMGNSNIFIVNFSTPTNADINNKGEITAVDLINAFDQMNKKK